MKTTISKTVTEEIELPEFPFYVKVGEWMAYKVMNETKCMAVHNFCDPAIHGEYGTIHAIDDMDNSEIITEEEFKEFYSMVLTKIEKNL